MAKPISNISHLIIVLLALAAAVGSTVQKVEGNDVCSKPLGECGVAGDCDQRCKSEHPDRGGTGSCDLNLCTCHFTCNSSSTAIPEGNKKCYTGLGTCSAVCGTDCCNSKCATQYNQGVGFCVQVGQFNVCQCQYICDL